MPIAQLMKWMILLIFLMQLPIATALGESSEQPICITGSPSRMRLHEQLTSQKEIAKDPFLANWYKAMNSSDDKGLKHATMTEAESCNCGPESNGLKPLSLISDSIKDVIARSTPKRRQIRRDCIATAVSNVRNVPARRLYCENERSVPARQAQVPCVTDTYVDFVHWSINKAIQCLSPAHEPLDPQMIFEKIHNESKFGTFIGNSNGIGMMQLTTLATKEMFPGGRGHAHLQKVMSENENACKEMKILTERPLDLDANKNARICQIMKPGSGAARNMLYGVGLYLYYRDGMRGSVHERLSKLGLSKNPEFAQMKNFMALISFSHWGPKTTDRAIDKLAPKIKSNMKFKDFESLVRSHFSDLAKKTGRIDYLAKIDRRMLGAFGDSFFECTEEVK